MVYAIFIYVIKQWEHKMKWVTRKKNCTTIGLCLGWYNIAVIHKKALFILFTKSYKNEGNIEKKNPFLHRKSLVVQIFNSLKPYEVTIPW